ncbi:MAG TPA: hypothetical protein VHP14_27100 [Anaerolineales bacterium]|nr:hypothetical protein [Anaerolineales bacterium]
MNKATRINVAILGVIFGISGMSHGFFETLQGNVPTGGLFIYAIGEAQKMWPHGNEPAFTLFPTFLLAGISSMIVGLTLIVWSLRSVHKKNGPTVLLILFIVLLLVGGGVAQVLFFPFLWLVATRIHQPLLWWRKVLSAGVQKSLARLWPWTLVSSAGLLVFALEIATTGFVPGVSDPELALSIMLFCLGLEVITLPLTFMTGFARDIVLSPNPS